MIEVIKHGKKKFTATCDNCGCEFTYELSDLDNSILYCPDCGHRYCHYPILETGGLYYPPNCRGFDCEPESTTTTNADEANIKGTLYGTQGDVYTTEKDLKIQQMFKDQMSKTTAIPCVDNE